MICDIPTSRNLPDCRVVYQLPHNLGEQRGPVVASLWYSDVLNITKVRMALADTRFTAGETMTGSAYVHLLRHEVHRTADCVYEECT